MRCRRLGLGLADRLAPTWLTLTAGRLLAAATAVPPRRVTWSAGRGVLTNSAALETLYRAAADVAARQVPGDVVECGVYNGGSAAAIAAALGDGHRTFWLYDSFQGMPPAGEMDGPYAQALPPGECRGSEQAARRALARAGVPPGRIRVRAGWFQDTFTAAPLPEAVAFLHIDADWYDSVLHSLRTFYPLVAAGGAVLLDDFGWWEGCRRAFYNFAAEARIHPLVDRAGPGQLLWFKGAANHRHLAPAWRERGHIHREFGPADH